MLSYFTATKLISHKTPFILLAYLTCCVWAYPSQSLIKRNAYHINSDSYNGNPNYYGYNLNSYPLNYENEEYEFQPQGMTYNQWDRADPPMQQQQQAYVDEEPASDYVSWSDLETLAGQNYGEDPTAVWGQKVYGRPESELEELKAEERRREEEQRELQQQQLMFQQQLPSSLDDQLLSQYFYETAPNLYSRQDKRDSPMPKHFKQSQLMQQHISSDAPQAATATPKSAHEGSATTIKTVAPTTVATPTTTAGRKPIHVQPGQKEIPMLRPPNKPKASSESHNDKSDDDEPIIQVAQRSSAADKPSAYDTLRKYLSLEDALKKEAEKRRLSAKSRLQKRAPAGVSSPSKKQIVSDLDSLTGQLHNLKKSFV